MIKMKTKTKEPTTKKEQLTEILQKLKKIGDILGSAVVSRDGLVVASDLSRDVDEDTFAAMSAAMQGAAETAVSELSQGELKQILVDAVKGRMLAIGAGKLAILVVLAKPSINLGLALLELKRASAKISAVLGKE
jgi:hypothetical protein